MRRRRVALLAAAAGFGGWMVVGPPAGWIVAPLVALVSWRVLQRAEPGWRRRQREAVARELPHLVDLLAVLVDAGRDPVDALDRVCRALPGAASDRLQVVVDRTRVGSSPAEAWAAVGDDPALAVLARAVVRSSISGSPVASAIERVAHELDQQLAADQEDRARRVGVLAAVPLGLCLLPAFMLLGIVPTVASLLAEVTR